VREFDQLYCKFASSILQNNHFLKPNEHHTELFHAHANGDKEAFGQLYKLYFPRLYAFSFKIIKDGNLAKDLVQNVFIKIWESPTVINIENPELFLYQMVRNACLNYIRHLKVVDNLKTIVKDQYLGEELYYIDLVGNQPYLLIEKELEGKIFEVMNSLPEKCLAVFRMSRIDGLKNREIAEQLGISLKAVEKHISKALQVYRDNFADYLPLHLVLLVLGGMK
jgi:RNA polymerase sigma-70 factor (ECF subfamily)